MERTWKGKGQEMERNLPPGGEGPASMCHFSVCVCACVCVSQRYPENNPEQKIFPRMCHLSACVSKVYHTRLYRYMY